MSDIAAMMGGMGGGGTGGGDMFAGLFGGGGAAGGADPFAALFGGGGNSAGTGAGGGNPLSSLAGNGGAGGVGGQGAGAGGGMDIFAGMSGGSPGVGGSGAGGAGAATGLGAAAGMAGMLNPMGPGRPFIPGMTPAQVSDLMNGRPGPVPMDIAQEALALRTIGWTPDQIADTLGDKLQRRWSNPLAAAAERAAMAALTRGAAGGGPGMGGPAGRRA
ncbi:PE-PGRS family protein PE_PGRS26-like [Mya arenaria]|uniref:PE-PGRS family protein PE_PGRS26-like n=1 Tax=Mya arenaria TaxID=6604 RepID=UPI0022E77568|nr:PE-PGRS family protein PE_PGRS26-like [Mya arenaria]